MPERVTSVRLSLQAQQYISGMREAGRVTQDTGTAAERLAGQREAFTQLGRSMVTAGALMAAGIGVAIARFAEFDQAMSQVKAITQESADNMDLLRAAALEAGGATVYTATEAANAIEELGKNGLTTAEILSGGLDSALSLAAAGGLEVARAAEIAAITSKQFNLEGSQLPHVADLMAAGAGKAAGDVDDMAQALSQAGLVAAQTGLSIEETTGVLSAFADNSLLGSDAGTSLRTMLLRLTPISGEASREMKRLGIDAYDAGGEFIGMAAFAGQLRDRLGGLTQEQRNTSLSIIFGQDAIRGATLLYSQGADGIQRYIDQTNDAGYASRVAADRLDNLTGDLEKLGGAFDTALIQSGSSANDVLRTMVQTATFLVDGFGSVPEPVLGAALALGTAAAAVLLVGGAALIAVPRFAELKRASDTLNISMGTVGKVVGIASGALAVAGTVISIWAGETAKARAEVEGYASTLDKATNTITNSTREMAKENLAAKQTWWFLESDSIYDDAAKIGLSLDLVTDAAMGNADALRELRDATDNGERGSEQFRAKLEELGIDAAEYAQAVQSVTYGVQGQSSSLDEAIRVAEQKASVDRAATDAANDQEEALAGLEGAAYDASGQIDELADAIRGFADTTLSTREAERDFQAAVDDLTDSIAQNGATLDINTEQGRDNESALDDIAKSSKELAAARLEETGSHEAASQAIADGRQKLIEALAQFGITGQAAEDYADKLGLIPANIETTAQMYTTAAQSEIDRFIASNSNRLIKIGVGTYANKSLPSADGNFFDYARAFANGGEGIYAGGAPLYKFAEPETGWETFISGRPGKEKENIGYALESLRRLGAFDNLRYPDSAYGAGAGSSRVSNVTLNTFYPIAETETERTRAGQQLAVAVMDA